MPVTYQILAFHALTVAQLYALLRLRAQVFVVEQSCVYQDLDDKDQSSLHVLAVAEDGRLAGYTRLLNSGIAYADYASIGRVVTAPFARGVGLGRPLMETSREALYAAYGKQAVKISAQAHLQGFYGSIGYVGVGAIYEEDGIPHRAMIYAIN